MVDGIGTRCVGPGTLMASADSPLDGGSSFVLRGPRSLSLNIRTRRVHRNDLELPVTRREFDLLRVLLEHQGEVVTADDLSREVWGHGTFGSRNYLDARMSRLRSKLRAGGAGGTITTDFWGKSTFDGGVFDLSGGRGSVLTGSGTGGLGGAALILSSEFDIWFGARVLADGGWGFGAGGDGGTFDLDSADQVFGNAGHVTLTNAIDVSGGASGLGGTGGLGGSALISALDSVSGDISVTGAIRAHGGAGGGAGSTGGAGGSVTLVSDGTLVSIAGEIASNGGSGGAAGGLGGTIDLGNDGPGTLLLQGNARVRANGGASTGVAGTIILDPTGILGANLIEVTGSIVETRDGDGTDVPANVTRD